MPTDPRIRAYLQRVGVLQDPEVQPLSLDDIVPPTEAVKWQPPRPVQEPAQPVPGRKPDYQGIGDALSIALSGMGDAFIARGGGQGQALPRTVENIRHREEVDVQQREKERLLGEKGKQDRTARSLLAQVTGKPEEKYAGMNAETIVAMAPFLKAYLTDPKVIAEQERKDKEFAMKKEELGMKREELDLKKTKVESAQDVAFSLGAQNKKMESLEKLKPVAVAAKTQLGIISRIKELASKRTTGLEGSFKAQLAPLMQMVGLGDKWTSFDDASKVSLLGRSAIGKMRLDLIGPGPVSEYEQKLLQQLAGGQGTPYTVVLELMNYYEQLAREKIALYNSEVDTSAANVNPRFSELYKKIEMEDVVEDLTPEEAADLERLEKKKRGS